MSDLGNKEVMAMNIKKFLDRKNMNAKELAEEIKVPYTTVCSWCQASSYPRIDKIEMMANFFGISKADLVESHPQTKESALEKAFSERPEMKMLFSVASKASKDEIEQAIKIIEALRK